MGSHEKPWKKDSVIVVYIPDQQHFIEQFYGLWYSLVRKTDLYRKYDFLVDRTGFDRGSDSETSLSFCGDPGTVIATRFPLPVFGRGLRLCELFCAFYPSSVH